MHVITELQYIQVKIDREIDKSTLTVRDFSVMDRLAGQKKERKVRKKEKVH